MGEIFIARSGQLSGFEKLVVIKKVLSHLAADREFIRRFIDEASVAIKLAHANICQVFEVGMVEEEYFLAMEWVDGRDLRRTLSRLAERRARLPVELALLVMRDVASGLAYAHRRTDDNGRPLNLVHCDISPPNVIVAFEGEVKIIDFGIAKSAMRQTQTNPRMGFGKYGYMAPEQLVQGGVIDRRTDIYAAGVLLFELLTGRRMFTFPEGADYRQMARMVTHGQHPRPSDVDPALLELDALVLRAVAADPARRHASAEELRDALQMALAQRSPTLTSDRLGAYLRELFAEELAEEREALRRVRAVDLAAYVDELEGGKTETVTFAAADEEISGIRTGAPAPRPPLPLAAAPEAPEVRPLLVGADRMGEVLPRRSRVPLILGGVAVLALAGLGVARLGADDPRPAPPAVAAPPPAVAPEPAPRVQPFVVQPIPEPAPEPAPPPPPPAPPAPPVAVKPAPPPRAERPRAAAPPRAPPARPPAPAPEVPTAASVQAKYQALARDYAEFRKEYGGRLEAEWGDILDFATYGSGEDKQVKLDAKLSQLRRRMAQIRAGTH
jgi:serine/threonine-protein kinase